MRVTPSFDPQARTRLMAAALAGVVIAGMAWGGAEYFVRSSRTRVQELQRQVNTLGPEVQRQEANRQTMALIGARAAAPEAFATQGPRLARVLEALASGAPGDIAISTLRMVPGIGTWKITINGRVMADTPALSQAVFNQFLRGATSSALLGQPARPPSISVETTPDAVSASDSASGAVAASRARSLDQLAPQERPRGVVIDESWAGGLGARDGRTAALLGRPPIRVAAEPHWYLHPGGVPKEVTEGIARYNAMQATAEQQVLSAANLEAVQADATRKAGSILTFTVEFEVRK